MNSYHKSVQTAPSGAGYFNIGVCYFQMGIVTYTFSFSAQIQLLTICPYIR